MFNNQFEVIYEYVSKIISYRKNTFLAYLQ